MVPIGPIRIPKIYKEGLDQLLINKPGLTYADLIREAICLLLKERGIIKDE